MTAKPTKEELIEQAKELGIDVKGNWGIPKLTEEIAKATKEVKKDSEEEKPKAEKPKEKEATASKGVWLYKGKDISDEEVLTLLKKTLNDNAANAELERMRTGRPYTSAIIGNIQFKK